MNMLMVVPPSIVEISDICHKNFICRFSLLGSMEIRFNDQADARLERGEINSMQCQRLKRGNIAHLLQLAYYPSSSWLLL